MKTSFNIGLMKIENHIVLKNNIYMTTFFGHYNVFSPFCSELVEKEISSLRECAEKGFNLCKTHSM
jgi:hypothetical protein